MHRVYLNLLLVMGFALEAHSQTPELISAHSLVTTVANDVDNELSNIIVNSDTSITIAGSFFDNFNVDLLGNEVLLSNPSLYGAGFFSNYGDSYVHISSMAIGNYILHAQKRNNSSFDIMGTFVSDSYLGMFNGEQLELTAIGAETLIANYDVDSNILWYKQITAQPRESVLTTSRHYFVGSCSNTCEIKDNLDTLIYPGGPSNNNLVIVLDLNGNLLATQILVSDGNDANFGCDYSETLSEFTVTGRSLGEMNYGWESAESYVIDHDGPAAFAASYNDQFELTSLIIITNQESGQNDVCEGLQTAYDSDGNMYFVARIEQGNYSLNINGEELDLSVESPLEHWLFKLNNEKELCWTSKIMTDNSNKIDLSRIKDLRVDFNGFIYAVGFFDSMLEIDQLGLSITGPEQSGFIIQWTPEGIPNWAYTISDGGLTSINAIAINNENEMHIGGWFTSLSSDFDFTDSDEFDLGFTDGKDPFLAKYQLSDPTPDIFVEQGWQTTEVTEGGATDNIYIRLSHAPQSAVQVVLTPNAQLDLGNGAGNAVTLTFNADQSAVVQQVVTVTANNDLTVEGNHSGNISFSISSNDAAFDVLTESSITVSITDNDVIGVEEQSALEFSLSPNPANDFITLGLSSPGNTTATIYDQQGKLVLTEKITALNQKIDVAHLPAGNYTCTVSNDGRSGSKMFMKR